MSSNYWSSTTNANNTNNAWHVNFNNGNDNNDNKSNSYYVRAVRAGKCELLSFASVYRAWLDCRKRKRGTVNALRFEYDLLENLTQLARDIQQGTYRPSRSVCFVTTSPKLREIFAADFRDRIVHHLVVRELEGIWEAKFIHDSFASRKGKGTHGAVRRLQNFMLKATRNVKRPALVLPLRQTLSSYLGHFKHADTFHLVQSLWRKHAWLAEYFIQDKGGLHERFRYRGVFRSFRAQLHFFRSRVTVPAVFLVRVGKFYELYGDDARAVGTALGLRLEEMRRGMAGVAGFPEWMRDRYVDRILAAGKDLAVMEENGPGEFVAERYVSKIFLREGELCVK